MTKFSLTIFFTVSFLFSNVIAKDVDMTFTLDLGGTRSLEFGQVYNFSITIINNGPEDAGTETSAIYPVAGFASNIALNDNGLVDAYFSGSASDKNCFIIPIVGSPPPGGEVMYSFEIGAPVIPAISSVTCFGHYSIGFEQGIRTLEFFVFSSQDNELNFDDNFQNIVFGIKPRSIPIMNNFTLFFTMMLFLIIGLRVISKCSKFHI